MCEWWLDQEPYPGPDHSLLFDRAILTVDEDLYISNEDLAPWIGQTLRLCIVATATIYFESSKPIVAPAYTEMFITPDETFTFRFGPND